jgi:hypothetical protein
MRRKGAAVEPKKGKAADSKAKKRGARKWDDSKPHGTLDFSNGGNGMYTC